MTMGGRGASSGIKRSIKGAGGGNVEKQERGSSNVNPQVTNITRDSLDADDSKALEKLREMAQRGEIPDKVIGSRENRAKIYEEMDKIYPEPSGFLGKYVIQPEAPGDYRLTVLYPNSFGQGEYPRVDPPRRFKASEAEKRGALKHAIYSNRDRFEYAFVSRGTGDGYWERVGLGDHYKELRFTDSEKKARIQDMYREIERVFGSPVSNIGRKVIENYMVKDGDKWRVEL